MPLEYQYPFSTPHVLNGIPRGVTMTSAHNKESKGNFRSGRARPSGVKSEALNLALVRRYETDLEAEFAKGHLEAAGIGAKIVKDDAGGMFPSLQQTEGVQLWVAGAQLDEAKRVLRLHVDAGKKS